MMSVDAGDLMMMMGREMEVREGMRKEREEGGRKYKKEEKGWRERR